MSSDEYANSDLARCPQPREINRTDWTFLLGMTEMEHAARRIVEVCKQAGRWMPVGFAAMTTDLERVGFVELVAAGYLVKHAWAGMDLYCRNGSFTPTPELIGVIVGQKGTQCAS